MFADYVKLARPDHWIKNVFVLPGYVLATVWSQKPISETWLQFLLGAVSVCLISSANYVLNEFLDARLDRFHPIKKNRPAALGRVQTSWVIGEYFALVAMGLGMAWILSPAFFGTSAALLVMGILYNVNPVRTKDVPYLDVLSESVNNPLRFLLGWFCFGLAVFPPSSALLGYWMGGAYLMALKRFAELRTLGDRSIAIAYRRSFKGYTQESILVSAVTYALCSAFFLGVLMVKHRIELLLAFPFLSIFFGWYLWIALKPDSAAQHPEKLYREVSFIAFTTFLALFLCALFVFRIPSLEWLLLSAFTK
jgi:decaprenyl-phosphate phosphoribosyltransferase